MYSSRAIDQNLKIAEQQLGFEPQRHSVEECDAMARHFDERLEQYRNLNGCDPGTPRAPEFLFSPDEVRWMENERRLCAADYLYYATRYGWILAEEEMVHYQPNTAQLIANDTRADLQDRGWVILEMYLKARQVGITTDSQMVISHRTFFHENTVALTGSSDKDRSREMVEKYMAIYDMLPYWLKPRRTSNRAGTRTAFDEMGSRLIVQHGQQKFDIGRGNTPTAFHLSEVASYSNTADLIDAGLMPAFHENPRKIGILESTGEGPFGWWYDTWESCKRNYWKGMANFRPIFLPWFVATNFCPPPAFLVRSLQLNRDLTDEQILEAAREKLKEWRPDPIVTAHAERAHKFVRANDLLSRYYPASWKMPLEQQWFWWVKREEYRAKKKLDRFLHEYAADDLEAFAASGDSVFDVDTLSEYNSMCKEPKGVFGFRSPGSNLIPARLQADEHWRDPKKRIIEVGPYQLVPLRWEGYQTSSVDGRLLVLEWPREGEIYGFGVDTSDGIGQDNSVVEGLCKGNLEHTDQQVCEFSSPYINSRDLAPIVHAIALFYQGSSTRQPKISVETGMNGEITQLELRKFGWSNFHGWIRYNRKKISSQDAVQLGWHTTRWSRPMLIDYLVSALRSGDIEINSPEFVKEMQSLHRDENMQSMRAETGQHDDRFMALGIAYVTLHILELTGKVASISAIRQKREEGGMPVYRELLSGDEPQEQPQHFKKRLPFESTASLAEAFAYHPGQVEEFEEVER